MLTADVSPSMNLTCASQVCMIHMQALTEYAALHMPAIAITLTRACVQLQLGMCDEPSMIARNACQARRPLHALCSTCMPAKCG